VKDNATKHKKSIEQKEGDKKIHIPSGRSSRPLSFDMLAVEGRWSQTTRRCDLVGWDFKRTYPEGWRFAAWKGL